MVSRYGNIVVELACRIMAPFILLFGFYVLVHGHLSPGGGFQGGAILAATIILLRLSLGKKRTSRKFPTNLAIILGAIGLLIYAGIGVAAFLCGGRYLDYAYLPIPGVTEAYRRYLGILFIEVGVFLGVFGIMLTIFDNLIEEE